jgi:hypothetical protein
MPLDGHLWTLRPWLAHQLRPARPPASEPWSAIVDDDVVGSVRIHGRLTAIAGAREGIVLVHGLGGSSDAHYMITAARAAAAAGLTTLRLDLRGAGGTGEDLYNAGLTADLRAAIASPALAACESIVVLGFSLGGHIALRYATEDVDPRVRAVAAVCPPIDLERSAAAIDQPERWVYRRHVLVSLKEMAAAVLARSTRGHRALPSMREVRSIARLRDWDEQVIAPRFGFRSAEHYYAEQSVAPRLHRLAVPALLVAATGDPMIPPDTVRPALAHRFPQLDVRWLDVGGHVGFPAELDLGLGGDLGLEPQVVRWLRKAAAG